MNLYARLSHVKADAGITQTGKDASVLRLTERVCRAVDRYVSDRLEGGRHFFSESATKYFDGEGGSQLWLGEDLLTVTTLKVNKDADLDYEVTVEASEYWLWPNNATPKRRIDLTGQGANLTSWPIGRRLVEIDAIWGYSEETESAGTLGAALTDSATTATMTTGHSVEAGDTIKIGDEQIYVEAVSGDTLTTIVRGVNGTTAAAHSENDAVLRRVYPEDVTLAVTMQVSRFLKGIETGFSSQVGLGEIGGFSFAAAYPAIRELLEPFRLRTVG